MTGVARTKLTGVATLVGGKMTASDRILLLLVLFAGVGFVTVLVWAVTGLTRTVDRVTAKRRFQKVTAKKDFDLN